MQVARRAGAHGFLPRANSAGAFGRHITQIVDLAKSVVPSTKESLPGTANGRLGRAHVCHVDRLVPRLDSEVHVR